MRRFSSQAAMVALVVVAVALAGCSAGSDSMRAAAAGDGSSASGAGNGSNGSALVNASSGDGRGGQGQMGGRLSAKELKDFKDVVDLPDIHFDFDSYEIRADAARILEASARWLKSNPRHLVLIEGHADERGTNEYNIALGERRAKAAMNYLVSYGVQASRISRISYGEERALCTQRTEECWAKNRRAHFAVKAQ